MMKSFIENTVPKMRKLHYVLKAYTFSNFISFTKENKEILRWQLSPFCHSGQSPFAFST